MEYGDLLEIQGNDHICKVPMSRSLDIEKEYLIFRKTFNLEEFKKKLFKDKTVEWVFYLNDFPYNVSKELKHIILWFNESSNNLDQNLKNAEKIIKNYFDDNVIWFTNVPEYSSIKQLFHVHIFIKN